VNLQRVPRWEAVNEYPKKKKHFTQRRKKRKENWAACLGDLASLREIVYFFRGFTRAGCLYYKSKSISRKGAKSQRAQRKLGSLSWRLGVFA